MTDVAPRRVWEPTPHAASEWLSWAKVAAIAAVVAIHVTGYNAIADGARASLLGRASIYVDKAAVFSVPIFVMISGALLLDPARYRGTKEFLAKRAWRLFPAIVFWNAFYFLYRHFYLGQNLTLRTIVVGLMNGKVFQALYYFWIILGLVLITPLLIPWVARARRWHVAVAGGALALMPALTIATHHLRGRTDVWIETPWTWWIFYSGVFLLGWAVRDAILVRWSLVVAIVVALALSFVGAWAWNNPDSPYLLGTVAPTNYYAIGTTLYALLILVILHSLAARVQPFTLLVEGRAARLGRQLGDATLGVFVLHSAIIVTLIHLGWPSDTPAVTSGLQLAARYVVVFVGTYVIVLAGRRVPYLRRLL